MDEIREAALPYRIKCTYEDYVKLPEGAPFQLIGGELVLTPAPTVNHQRISRNLAAKMVIFSQEHDLGEVFEAPVDVYFNGEETYQPDVFFISWDRENIIGEDRVNGAPDLVVEILSPSTAIHDLRSKFKIYELYGVKEYWIIDPKDKSITVYVQDEGRLAINQRLEGKGVVESKALSGFTVEVEHIFRRR